MNEKTARLDAARLPEGFVSREATLETVRSAQVENGIAMIQSHDFREGNAAFREKREPRWRGR